MTRVTIDLSNRLTHHELLELSSGVSNFIARIRVESHGFDYNGLHELMEGLGFEKSASSMAGTMHKLPDAEYFLKDQPESTNVLAVGHKILSALSDYKRKNKQEFVAQVMVSKVEHIWFHNLESA